MPARPTDLRLTDKTVKGLAAPASGGRKYRDRDLRGFCVQVAASGQRSFGLVYRSPLTGRERLLTIGAWPTWTTEVARNRAKELRRLVDRGIDPLEQREQERNAPTVADMIERYEREHLPRKAARWHNEDRALARYIKDALGDKKVAAVEHDDIDRLHGDITRRGRAIRANRVASLASKMFSLASRWGWRSDNPVRGLARNPETKRTRYLTPAELQRLGAVLDARPKRQAVSANAVRLLLLTGCRSGELLGATWAMFDLENGTWVKPSAHTKQRKEHRLPLSAAALQILVGMKASSTSEFLFPGPKGKPIKSIKTFWAAICGQAGLAVRVEKRDSKGQVVRDRGGKPVMRWKPTLRLHDLRHTNASILVSAGLSLPVIGAMLGHTQPGTTSRYAHLMDDPLRAAAERVSAIVRSINSRTGADVVDLPRRAAN
jgi:integrase